MATRIFTKVHHPRRSIDSVQQLSEEQTRTGTGSLPGLGKKRQGRHSPRSKAPYILMDERMRTFVTPTSQANPDVGDSRSMFSPADSFAQLRAYVSRAVDPGHPKHWPFADTKPEEHRVIRPMKERSIYSENGFDGYYYLQLARGREKGSIINPTEPTPCVLLYTRGAITHARSRSLLPDAISKYLPGPNKSN